MTAEERRELCADLRASWFEEAADEIERLAHFEGFVGTLRQRIAELEADQPTIVRALLREARPYVASAKGDDDPETHNLVDGLLRDIDAALAERGDND
jgi:hypothetical protein